MELNVPTEMAEGLGAPSRLRRMERDEFEAFYVATVPGLRAYLIRCTGSAALADDLLQDAYMRILAAAPENPPQRRAYLYRAATNLLLDYHRRRQRERGWKERLGLVRYPGPSRSMHWDVAAAFARLTIRDRSLLWLAYVEEMSHAEVATALGCGERSVRVMLFRARQKMEKALNERS
jgi:RNA polymerase sigma-70 factor (ECF subfamily)